MVVEDAKSRREKFVYTTAAVVVHIWKIENVTQFNALARGKELK